MHSFQSYSGKSIGSFNIREKRFKWGKGWSIVVLLQSFSAPTPPIQAQLAEASRECDWGNHRVDMSLQGNRGSTMPERVGYKSFRVFLISLHITTDHYVESVRH